jgi:hypothetical protein
MDGSVTVGSVLVILVRFETESVIGQFDDDLIVEEIDLIP